MPVLAAVERFFERLLERPSARLFRTRLQPVQLQRRIERAMESERLAATDRTLVPEPVRRPPQPGRPGRVRRHAGVARERAGRWRADLRPRPSLHARGSAPRRALGRSRASSAPTSRWTRGSPTRSPAGRRSADDALDLDATSTRVFTVPRPSGADRRGSSSTVPATRGRDGRHRRAASCASAGRRTTTSSSATGG